MVLNMPAGRCTKLLPRVCTTLCDKIERSNIVEISLPSYRNRLLNFY